ncbi:MAG: hypothetical protein KAQ68_03815 [Clostridiales bacterium]|nr:hypothetical protein [Clostridiales bacterium]
MNIHKIKIAQEKFYAQFPNGFDSPEMVEVGKKHKMKKYITFAQESFSLDALKDIEASSDNMIKMVTRSSMVSVFEKPKFRDAVRGMSGYQKVELVSALSELLHGNEEKGFNELLDILIRYSLAKWTLMTVFGCYYTPHKDLLFKPTTVKNVIKHFELEGLEYKPRPSYHFFVLYSDTINEMKKHVDENFKEYNAGFSGFLMMAMEM